MNNNAFSLLGLCRRAGKLSMGHDMCKGAIRGKKACLCLVSCESSERVTEEFMTLCRDSGIKMFKLPLKIDEIHHLIGYKAGVITVDDSGFAESVMKSFNKNTFVEEIDL